MFSKTGIGSSLKQAFQDGLNKSLSNFTGGYSKKMESISKQLGKDYKFDKNLGKTIQEVSQSSESIQSLSETAATTSKAMEGVEVSAESMSKATALASEGTAGLEGMLGGVSSALGELAPLILLAAIGFEFQMTLLKPLREFGKWITGPTLDGIKKT